MKITMADAGTQTTQSGPPSLAARWCDVLALTLTNVCACLLCCLANATDDA